MTTSTGICASSARKVAHHHDALGEVYLLPRIPHHVQQGREINLYSMGCDVACITPTNPISFSTSLYWCSFHLLPALGHQSKSSMLIHRLSAKIQRVLWLLFQIIDSALQFERCYFTIFSEQLALVGVNLKKPPRVQSDVQMVKQTQPTTSFRRRSYEGQPSHPHWSVF